MPESNGSPPSPLLPLLSPIARLMPELVGTGHSGGLVQSTSAQGDTGVFSRDGSTARGPSSSSSPIIQGAVSSVGSGNPPLSAEDDHNSEDNSKIIAITHPGNSESTSHGHEEPASEAFNWVHEARNGPCSIDGSCVRCSCGQKCQHIRAFGSKCLATTRKSSMTCPPPPHRDV